MEKDIMPISIKGLVSCGVRTALKKVLGGISKNLYVAFLWKIVINNQG
jgi:hypothetical protein